MVEHGGEIIEDGTWLRKVKDPLHINYVELMAVLKGIKLAVQWEPTDLDIVTDLSTVHKWLLSMANGQKPWVSRDSEVLVRRWLAIIEGMLEGVRWTIQHVPSPANKARPTDKTAKGVAEGGAYYHGSVHRGQRGRADPGCT